MIFLLTFFAVFFCFISRSMVFSGAFLPVQVSHLPLPIKSLNAPDLKKVKNWTYIEYLDQSINCINRPDLSVST